MKRGDEMKINNLGPLKNIEIKLNDMMIFNGSNNSGKTYLSYIIYSFFDYANNLNDDFLSDNEKKVLLQKGTLEFSLAELETRFIEVVKNGYKRDKNKILRKYFADYYNEISVDICDEDVKYLLENSMVSMGELSSSTLSGDNYSIKISFDYKTGIAKIQTKSIKVTNEIKLNQQLNNMLLKKETSIDYFSKRVINSTLIESINSMYFPAERSGISLLSEEISSYRSNYAYDNIDGILIEETDNSKKISKVKENAFTYPKPVSDYLKFINSLKNNQLKKFKNDNPEFEDMSKEIRKELMNGYITYKLENKEILFHQFDDVEINFKNSSSSIKSLYGFDEYIKNANSRDNNFIFIDEPELNLHPTNQIKFVNIIESLLNMDFKFVITTHSDYIIRKIYNLILKNEANTNPGVKFKSQHINTYYFNNGGAELLENQNFESFIKNFNSTLDSLDEELYNFLSEK